MSFRKIYKEDLKLRVEGSKLMFSNLILTEGGKRTNLVADVSAGGTTLTVANHEDISDDDYLLIDEWGESIAEIVQINDVSVDGTITIGALAHDHYTDTPVTVIPCDSVEFARAVTLVDANDGGVVTQLGTDVPIMAYRKETIYNDPTNTTGYAYARFQKTQSTIAYSEYTVGVSYEGNPYNSVEKMFQEAVNLVGIEVGDTDATERELMRDINQCQNIIVKTQDWAFELIEDNTSIVGVEDQYIYPLSDLAIDAKYPNTEQGIMNVIFGTSVLSYIDWYEFEALKVWDDVSAGTPSKYSIFNGDIYLNVPVESGDVGEVIKIKYLKKLARFTDFSDVTTIPFYEAIPFYLAYKIETRRKNYSEAKMHKGDFSDILEINTEAYKMPVLEDLEYYEFNFSN